MSSVRIPPGYWVALAVLFAVLAIVFLVKGTILAALVALGAALWTGLEGTGRGIFTSADRGRR